MVLSSDTREGRTKPRVQDKGRIYIDFAFHANANGPVETDNLVSRRVLRLIKLFLSLALSFSLTRLRGIDHNIRSRARARAGTLTSAKFHYRAI